MLVTICVNLCRDDTVSIDLSGRTAIVTGSSSGIGKATALALARAGAAVCVVADRNVDGGSRTAAEINDAGGRAVFVQADVACGDGCARIAAQALEGLGPVDILVNNAGRTVRASLPDLDEATWD